MTMNSQSETRFRGHLAGPCLLSCEINKQISRLCRVPPLSNLLIKFTERTLTHASIIQLIMFRQDDNIRCTGL